jgi:hypothetical protein
LDLVEVVDLVPDLIEPDELNEDLFLLLDGVQVRLGVVLDLVDLLSDGLLHLRLFLALLLVLQLLLDLLDIVVNVLGVVELLDSEVSLEQRNLEPVAKLYLFVLYE